MSEFGTLLKQHREKCTSPHLRGGRLSQKRLGELLGEKLGDYGYSGVTIHNWEYGKTKIAPEQRALLIAIIEILVEYDGMVLLEEANGLLRAGYYAALGVEDGGRIFPEQQPEPEAATATNVTLLALQRAFVRPEQIRQWTRQMLLEDGMITLLRDGTSNWTAAKVLRIILLVISLILTVAWLLPVLFWSAAPTYQATQTTWLLYIAITLLVPVLVGAAYYSRPSTLWTERGVGRFRPRLYLTLMGAYMGQVLAMTAVSVAGLFKLYIWGFPSPRWLLVLVALFFVLFIRQSAREMAHIHWNAFGRLQFSASELPIAIVFAALPLIVGYLYQIGYRWLLQPQFGLPILFTPLLIYTLFSMWQERTDRSWVIPVYAWTGYFGTMMVLWLMAQNAPLLLTVPMGVTTAALTVLLRRQRIHFTLKGAVSFLIALLLLIVTATYLPRPVTIAVLVLLLWLKSQVDNGRGGPQQMRVGSTIVWIYGVLVVCVAAVRYDVMTQPMSMIVLTLITAVLLWLDADQ